MANQIPHSKSQSDHAVAAPCFVALPVGQGDAFYLKRDGFSVLVDGGKSKSGFPSMFQTHTGSDGVDVIVCTHNDADHANGILGFLDAGLRCEEVWLPGLWLAVLPDVLRPFEEVFLDLESEISDNCTVEIEEHQRDRSLMEVYGDRLKGPFDNLSGVNEGPSVERDGWPGSSLKILEQSEPWGIPSCVHLWRPFDLSLYCPDLLGSPPVRLLWLAIENATRIRDIAVNAFHRGIHVRWFEVNPAKKPSGGEEADLQPVNAQEVKIVSPRPSGVRLLDSLALTELNKKSLVFWAPLTAQHSGVLFTADSDLEGAHLPSQIGSALATAPHHGSESNKRAYDEVTEAAQKDSSSITWVRSDRRCRSRPCKKYLRQSSRFCTICRSSEGMSSQKQAVQLIWRNGGWTPRATVKCSCVEADTPL